MKKVKLGKVTGLLAAALALGVLLAACSGETPPSTQTNVPAATIPPTQAAIPTQQATTPTQQAALPTQQAALPTQQATLPTQTTPAPRPTASPTVAIIQQGPPREIKVLVKDNTFPKVTDFIAGETVRMIITNNGSVEHTFEITDLNILWKIGQGKTEAFEWTVPNAPGEYDCGCFLTGEDPTAHERMNGICNILRAKA